MVRVIGPVQQAGLVLIKGSEWAGDQIRCFPERVSEADIIVVQRDFPRYVEEYECVVAAARAQGKAIIYELDDLLTELPSWHPDVRRYQEARAPMMQAIVEADAVTCATSPLGDYLRPFNSNVWLLPNYLNDRLWAEVLNKRLRAGSNKSGEQRPVVVGYLGGHSHLSDLEMIEPTLIQILRRYGDRIMLRFWGGAPPVKLLDWKNVEWMDPGLVDYAEFVKYFSEQESDVFIAPLRDCQFNRCKSALKFLEYSALGVAGVYSRITPYERVVTHQENGFLASDLEEWEEYLSRLIEDLSLRRHMGLEAQRTVREQWLLSPHAHEWPNVYSQIADSLGKTQRSPTTLLAMRKLRIWDTGLQEYIREKEQTVETLGLQLADQENTLRSLGLQLEALGVQLAEKERVIQTITTSPSWRLLQVLESLVRRFIPRGSRRERLLQLGMQALWVWNQEGFRAFAHKVLSGLKQLRGGELHPGVELSPTSLSIQPGETCPAPAISVVAIRGVAFPEPDEQAVVRWAATQTCRAIEVAIWDKDVGVAYLVDDTETRWGAPDVQPLCQGLRGRYVCIASPDLLQQPETYLEENLIALESEGLAFAINMRGTADEALRYLLGLLPGNRQLPLLRQVVRKDCLRNDFSLDLSTWVDRQEEKIIGKLIVHTTRYPDPVSVLPYNGRLTGVATRVLERYVLPQTGETVPKEVPARTVHPVDTVLPLLPDLADIPTVIVVLPFLAVGGAERVALDMMRHLQRQIRFIVVTVEEHDPALGTTVDAFRQVTPYVFTAPDFLLPPLNLSFMTYLIERFKPRTLYIANGAGWIYDALGTLKQRYPTLRTVNQVYDYTFGWINRYDSELVAHLDAHIGVNQKVCQAYIRRGARPEQVYLIEHGVDTSEFDPDRYSEERRRSIWERLGLPQGQRLVTFIGRLHPQKRPMDFVELARRFADIPFLTFLIVGDGPLGGVLDTEVLRIGLKNLIRRPFYHPSSDIFAISDVIVLPSEYEGMPLVVLEAQAMGKPVVVTDVGNNREILDITRGGVVVAGIGDIAALREGVWKVLNEPPDPHQTRQAIQARFGLKQIADKYLDALLGG